MSQQSGEVANGLFTAYRSGGTPTYYAENHTPWQVDFLEAGFYFAFGILAFSFYCILPGIHGRDRLFNFTWITLSLTVGAIIVVSLISKEWEVASVVTSTKYKAGTGREINASVGVHIGLHGINITLKGEPVHQLNETINYNEDFSWTWRQGLLGFGPNANHFNQEFRAAQFRGLPLPILWIAEYFTLDDEGIRWGRHYLSSGYFAQLVLWLALCLWFLTNIMFFVLLRYASYSLVLTGVSMLTASAIKHWLRNPLDLEIPFSAEHILKFKYGTTFWLCFGAGSFCILCGITIFLMDLRIPLAISRFFGVTVLQDEELIQKEATTISSQNSDLTEIVEVGSNGEVVKRVGIRPPGAPKNGSNVKGVTSGKQLDDVYGDSEWIDYSSESEIEPTDDEEEEEEEEEPRKKSPEPTKPGIINKFQKARRIQSAGPKGSNSRPGHGHGQWAVRRNNPSRVHPTTDRQSNVLSAHSQKSS